jgi:oligosaccharide reducing-end xylanase
MEKEIGESQAVINSHINAQQCTTFVYPFGEYNSDAKIIAEQYYIAARGVSCDLNVSPYNFYGMKGCGESRSLEQMKSMADSAELEGGWLISYFHALDAGYWTTSMFVSYLDYLETKDLWVGTFGSVAKYIKERESATLSLISSSQDQIVLNLTDTLDDSIFDEPLTIRSEVPSDWTTVRVQQGANAIPVTPVVEGTKSVVYYPALPDGGLITLEKYTYDLPFLLFVQQEVHKLSSI